MFWYLLPLKLISPIYFKQVMSLNTKKTTKKTAPYNLHTSILDGSPVPHLKLTILCLFASGQERGQLMRFDRYCKTLLCWKYSIKPLNLTAMRNLGVVPISRTDTHVELVIIWNIHFWAKHLQCTAESCHPATKMVGFTIIFTYNRLLSRYSYTSRLQ